MNIRKTVEDWCRRGASSIRDDVHRWCREGNLRKEIRVWIGDE